MEFHHLSTLREDGKAYVEFLRTASLSAGVYRLPSGGTDSQAPHGEEEIYYVVSGCAHFASGSNDVAAGRMRQKTLAQAKMMPKTSEALEQALGRLFPIADWKRSWTETAAKNTRR